MKKLTSENEGQYKTLIKLIQYVMIKIEKKRSELKAK